MKKLLFIAFLLSACASNFESKLDTWIGMDEVDLVRAWGTPSSILDYESIRIIKYASGGATLVPYSSGMSSFAVIPLNCTIEFIIEETGKVSSWRYDGNNCY